MKMNIIDKNDRTCMHYAAIQGKSTLINTLFLLWKSNGGKFVRAEIDPNFVDSTEKVKGPLITEI